MKRNPLHANNLIYRKLYLYLKEKIHVNTNTFDTLSMCVHSNRHGKEYTKIKKIFNTNT